MLVEYTGDNYKDAEKVNKHIKEVAVEALPVLTENSMQEILPEFTKEQKYYVLMMLGFKPYYNESGKIVKSVFTHPVLNEVTVSFDTDTEQLSLLVERIFSIGCETCSDKQI